MKCFYNKKAEILSLISGILILGAFAFRAPVEEDRPPRRDIKLKILPKSISHEDLMKVMHSYEHALNFKCEDCHAGSKTDPTKLDFASFDNPRKKVALGMMKMVERINRKNFGVKGPFKDNYLQGKYEVTCYTCHHGDHKPLTNPAALNLRQKSSVASDFLGFLSAGSDQLLALGRN